VEGVGGDVEAVCTARQLKEQQVIEGTQRQAVEDCIASICKGDGMRVKSSSLQSDTSEQPLAQARLSSIAAAPTGSPVATLSTHEGAESQWQPVTLAENTASQEARAPTSEGSEARSSGAEDSAADAAAPEGLEPGSCASEGPGREALEAGAHEAQVKGSVLHAHRAIAFQFPAGRFASEAFAGEDSRGAQLTFESHEASASAATWPELEQFSLDKTPIAGNLSRLAEEAEAAEGSQASALLDNAKFSEVRAAPAIEAEDGVDTPPTAGGAEPSPKALLGYIPASEENLITTGSNAVDFSDNAEHAWEAGEIAGADAMAENPLLTTPRGIEHPAAVWCGAHTSGSLPPEAETGDAGVAEACRVEFNAENERCTHPGSPNSSALCTQDHTAPKCFGDSVWHEQTESWQDASLQYPESGCLDGGHKNTTTATLLGPDAGLGKEGGKKQVVHVTPPQRGEACSEEGHHSQERVESPAVKEIFATGAESMMNDQVLVGMSAIEAMHPGWGMAKDSHDVTDGVHAPSVQGCPVWDEWGGEGGESALPDRWSKVGSDEVSAGSPGKDTNRQQQPKWCEHENGDRSAAGGLQHEDSVEPFKETFQEEGAACADSDACQDHSTSIAKEMQAGVQAAVEEAEDSWENDWDDCIEGQKGFTGSADVASDEKEVQPLAAKEQWESEVTAVAECHADDWADNWEDDNHASWENMHSCTSAVEGTAPQEEGVINADSVTMQSGESRFSKQAGHLMRVAQKAAAQMTLVSDGMSPVAALARNTLQPGAPAPVLTYARGAVQSLFAQGLGAFGFKSENQRLADYDTVVILVLGGIAVSEVVNVSHIQRECSAAARALGAAVPTVLVGGTVLVSARSTLHAMLPANEGQS
jgi:hypothetical protein